MLEHKQTTLHRASIVSKRDDYLTWPSAGVWPAAPATSYVIQNSGGGRHLVAAANAGPSDRPFFWTWFNKNIRHSVSLCANEISLPFCACRARASSFAPCQRLCDALISYARRRFPL